MEKEDRYFALLSWSVAMIRVTGIGVALMCFTHDEHTQTRDLIRSLDRPAAQTVEKKP